MDTFSLMLKNQRKDIGVYNRYKKINYKSLLRLSRNLPTTTNPFGNDCCKYNGEIIMRSRENKRKKFLDVGLYYYPVFTYNGNKLSLLRLLYHNFIGDLEDNDINYVFTTTCGYCDCCNINHICKKPYKEKNNE